MAKTVLVVDDEPDFLELLELILTEEAYQVVSCPISLDAHQTARQLVPDIVIVDLLMPGLGGWQVIELLKSDPVTSCIHIIVCTAAVAAAMQHIARLRQWGCDILLKPFELDDLLELLAKVDAKSNAC